MHNVSGYITEYSVHAASLVVGITDDEMLDRFVARLKPKICEYILLSQADTFEKSLCFC